MSRPEDRKTAGCGEAISRAPDCEPRIANRESAKHRHSGLGSIHDARLTNSSLSEDVELQRQQEPLDVFARVQVDRERLLRAEDLVVLAFEVEAHDDLLPGGQIPPRDLQLEDPVDLLAVVQAAREKVVDRD